MDKKVFIAGKLYDGSADSPKTDTALMIEKGRIVMVGSPAQAKEWAGADAEWVETPVITPGLIDVHVHLMMRGNGEMAEVTLSDNTLPELQLMALTNALTALRAGVTTLRDCGAGFGISRAVKSFVNRGRIQGPDVFICGSPLTSTGGHCHYMGGEVDGDTDIRKFVRRQQKEGIDFVKLMATHGGTIGVVRGNTFQPFEYRAAVEEAHRLGLPISMHCCTYEGIFAALDAGCDGIEHAMFTSEAGEFILDEALSNRMAEQGVYVCHTLPALGAALWHLNRKPRETWTAFDISEYDRISEAQERLYKTLLLNYQSGVRVVAGSDSGWKYCGFGLGMPLALELMAQSGLPAAAIMHSATGLAAEYLGAGDRLGYLKKGYQADLLLLGEDPASDAEAFYRPLAVYKEGKPVTDFLADDSPVA